MLVFDSGSSPFLVLWYFYLVFLGAVLLINVIALLTRKLIEWRTKRLLRIKKARS